MKEHIDSLIYAGLGSVMDKNIDEEIMTDDVYNGFMKKAEQSQGELNRTALSEEQKELLENYESSILSANERACNLAYLTGLKDTVLFMSEMRMLGNVSQ